MASPALRDDGDDGDQQSPPRRRHTHRHAPYSMAHEHWPACVADAVSKALQRGLDDRHPHHESAAPMMRRRRLLAAKVALTAQSAINMAAYLERRAVLMRSTRVAMVALATTADRNSCGSEEAAGAQDEDEEDDGGEWTLCCICLEKNRPNNTRRPVKALQCSHVFHRDCISQWMSYKRCCPVDRLEIAEDA